MSRQSRSRALARKHREARQEKARLAAIEKSQKERAALKAKYGSGGLPADYKETEKKAFKEAEEWQEQKTQTQFLEQSRHRRWSRGIRGIDVTSHRSEPAFHMRRGPG